MAMTMGIWEQNSVKAVGDSDISACVCAEVSSRLTVDGLAGGVEA